jgi:hypothetical protein
MAWNARNAVIESLLLNFLDTYAMEQFATRGAA